MKANELRIGNLIGYCADILTCNFETKEVDSEFLILLLDGRCQIDADCRPIPLTEEWLPRLGFPEDRNTMDLLFNYIIYLERQSNNIYLCNNQTKAQYLIEWVHEAQNIKYILTGEELEIKKGN